MNPKVSVIIPTYNRAATVGNAIESVLAQTFSDLEVIVVDDGSSDDTGRILQETYGDRIRYFAQANQGVSAARNKGLAEARGEWIALLDSDDLWEKEKLEWQFKALERFGSQCGVCYADARFFNYPESRTMLQLSEESYRHEGTMGINTDVLRLLVKPGGAGMVVCPSSLLARADVVAKSGGFDPSLRFGEDSEFMFRLALLTGFCYVNRPLVSFDRSPAELRHLGVSAEWNQLEFVLRQTQIRFEKFLRLSEGLPRKVRKSILAGLGSVHSGLANCHLEAGEYGKARQAASKAAQLDLTLNFAVKWLLTWISPRLALRAVQRHQQTRKDLVPFI
ncbi:MAG: glycosyltransferase family 2 protein [Candidatus Sulfotelmatobacter sp.]